MVSSLRVFKRVTGAATLTLLKLQTNYQKLKQKQIFLSVLVLGSVMRHLPKAMGGVADAVIVGSAFVKTICKLATERRD